MKYILEVVWGGQQLAVYICMHIWISLPGNSNSPQLIFVIASVDCKWSQLVTPRVFPTTGYWYYSLTLMTDCRILQFIFADALINLALNFTSYCCNQQRLVVWRSPIKHGNGFSNPISCQGFQWDTAVLLLKLFEWSTHHFPSFVTSITSIAQLAITPWSGKLSQG